MDKLRELLQIKINANKELKDDKLELLKEMLNDDTLFLKIDMDTAVGILDYLGVPKTEIKALYIDLICNGKDLKIENKQYYIPRD